MSESIVAILGMGFLIGFLSGGMFVGILIARADKGSKDNSESTDKDDGANVRDVDNHNLVLRSGDSQLLVGALGDVHGKELDRYPMGYNPWQE